MVPRKQRERQEALWYEAELPIAPAHPFYTRLNEVLDKLALIASLRSTEPLSITRSWTAIAGAGASFPGHDSWFL